MKHIITAFLVTLLACRLPAAPGDPPSPPVKPSEADSKPSTATESEPPAKPARPADSERPGKPATPADADQASKPATPAAPDRTAKQEAPPVQTSPAPATAFADASNAFALKLHKSLSAGASGENLAFSPLSLATSLSLTAAGAKGITQAEMMNALQWTGTSDIHESAGALVKGLSSADDRVSIDLALGVWVKPDVNLRQEFTRIASEQYKATSEALDFSNPAKAVAHLNGWVSHHTKERINTLFTEDSVKRDTQCVLASAVAFKGQWETTFKAADTTEDTFTISKKPAQTTRVSFMHRTGRMQYAEGPTYQALRLPYAGKAWSILFLLPKEGTLLAELEKNLSVDQLKKASDGLQLTQVALSLPKFTANSRLDVGKTLSALGMKSAFGSNADFTRLVDKGGDHIAISKILHQTFVEVNETGTEAAAATGVIMRPKGMVLEEPAKVFNANRPFLYFIQQEDTGAIVFLGRVTKPSAARGVDVADAPPADAAVPHPASTEPPPSPQLVSIATPGKEPQVTVKSALPAGDDLKVLTINTDQKFYLENEEIPHDRLAAALTELKSVNPGAKLKISVLGDAPHRLFVMAVNAAHAAKVPTDALTALMPAGEAPPSSSEEAGSKPSTDTRKGAGKNKAPTKNAPPAKPKKSTRSS